jgi:hypothetical protein
VSSQSPREDQRTPALAVAIVFLGLCLGHVVHRIDGLEQHFELTGAEASPPVYGQVVLSFDHQPTQDTMERVAVFIVREGLGRHPDTTAVLSLRDPASSAVVQRAESVVSTSRHPWRADLEFETEWVVEPGRTYRLELSLPEARVEDNLRFQMSAAYAGTTPRLWVGGREFPGQALDLLVFSSRPAFPTQFILAGLLLLLLALAGCPAWGSAAALLVTIGMAATLSTFVWEGGVWRFYGEYWPDSRVYLGHVLRAGLVGDMSLGQAWQLVSGHLQGAMPLVPILLALLGCVGVPSVYGFALLSLCFGSATLIVIARFLRRHTTLQPRQVAIVVALTGLHFAVLRGFTRPQTDAAGVFFCVLFVSALVDLSGPGGPAPGAWRTSLAALVLGLLSRIALLPLLAVPVVLSLWRLFTRTASSSRQWVWRPALLSLGGCAILALIYQLFGLWDSLAQMRSTAAGTEFTTLTFGDWATHSAWTLQLALPLALLSWRRVLKQDTLLIPTITGLGFLAMLIVFDVIHWYRYWAPVAPLAVIVAGTLLFGGERRAGSRANILCAVIVLANLAWVAVEKSY